MSDLAEFLLARIAEDEAVARAADPVPTWINDGGTVYAGHPTDAVVDYTNAAEHIARWDPARVLAECEAKRRIVAQYRLYDAYAQQHRRPEDERERMNRYAMTVWDALRALALPYADHPDYREEWRP